MIRLPITAATPIAVEGETWLELTVGDTTATLTPQKATLLQNGMVALPAELSSYGEPLSVATDELQDVAVENVSADPVLLELARRMWVGELVIGQAVDLPPEIGRWLIDPAAGIFRREIQR
jgi:hypothetical protein